MSKPQYYFTAVRMAVIKKADKTKTDKNVNKLEPFIHC